MFSTGWLPPTHPIFLSSVLDETDGDEMDQQFGLYITHCHILHTWQSGTILGFSLMVIKKYHHVFPRAAWAEQFWIFLLSLLLLC